MSLHALRKGKASNPFVLLPTSLPSNVKFHSVVRIAVDNRTAIAVLVCNNNLPPLMKTPARVFFGHSPFNDSFEGARLRGARHMHFSSN